MIIVNLKGGLGNQMFQYALGRRLSHDHNVPFKLDTSKLTKASETFRTYKLRYFNIQENIASPTEVQILKYPYGLLSEIKEKFYSKILSRFQTKYESRILEKKSGYLEGYWQRYVYTDAIKHILKNEFTLKHPLSKEYSEIATVIKNSVSVALHVRRGDYITDPTTNAYHGVCSPSYYKNALEIIRSKVSDPELFIFSDDIDWCKENLNFDMPTTFVPGSADKDYEELILMSLCKHNIIANSSFSWWAGYLNDNPDKIVIAPKQWFSVADENTDLIPKEWLRI